MRVNYYQLSHISELVIRANSVKTVTVRQNRDII